MPVAEAGQLVQEPCGAPFTCLTERFWTPSRGAHGHVNEHILNQRGAGTPTTCSIVLFRMRSCGTATATLTISLSGSWQSDAHERHDGSVLDALLGKGHVCLTISSCTIGTEDGEPGTIR